MTLTKNVNEVSVFETFNMSNPDDDRSDPTPSSTNNRTSTRNKMRVNYDESVVLYGDSKDAQLSVNEYKPSSTPTVNFRQRSKGIDTPKKRIANLQEFFDTWGETLSINPADAETISLRIINQISSFRWTCITETDVDRLQIPETINDESISEFRLRLFDNHHLSIKRSHFIKNDNHPWGLFAGAKSYKSGDIIGLYLGSYVEVEQNVLSSGYQLHQIDAKQGYGGPGWFGIHFANDPSLTYLYALRAYINNERATKPKQTHKKVNAKFVNYKLVATKKIDPGTEILVNYFAHGKYKQEEKTLKELVATKEMAVAKATKERKKQMRLAAKNLRAEKQQSKKRKPN